MKMISCTLKDTDSKSIGTDIANKAIEDLGLDHAFAILYIAPNYDCYKVVKDVRSVLGDIPLIGCTTGGEFTNKTVSKNSVQLTLFSKSEDYMFYAGISDGLSNDPNKCVQDILDIIPKQNEKLENRSAILLHDGLSGRGEEVVLSAGILMGPSVSFVGGSAADYLEFKETLVFCNDKVMKDAVVLGVIDSKLPVSVSVNHGHVPISEKMTVTKAKENIVYEIDGENAWDVWKRIVSEKLKIDVSEINDASSVGEFLIKYEMGLTIGDNEYKIRVPLSKNDDGSLSFACTILEGTKFAIMKSSKSLQIDSAKKAAEQALDSLDRDKISGALVFDCVCRDIILGDNFKDGVSEISSVFGEDVTISGFETYGEICRPKNKISGYHNTTTSIMLLQK